MSLIQHLVRFITGGAVDITLVDLEGNELDMGTTFDFLGRKLIMPTRDFLPKFSLIENCLRKLWKNMVFCRLPANGGIII